MTGQPAFLSVEASLTGRRWAGLDLEVERRGMAIAQATGIPELVARVLARSDVDLDIAEAYLTPTLRDLMPDPSTILDMDVAANRLVRAITAAQSIAVFGDYDVDGGASAALLLDWVRSFGLDATLYIPDRMAEGYGPNTPAMSQLGQDHDLILCVDCGTLAHDPIKAAVAAGADVIVLDHHQGGEELPPACAVVNPNRQDEAGTLGYLCAAGVVFMLLVAANRLLRAKDLVAPDLLPLLDLVALATVADVAPLKGLNRAFVRQGLKVMAQRQRPGLAALSDVAGLRSAPAPYHLGYLLGPRINAGGRIGEATLGARLLTETDPMKARHLADRLNILNEERRAIEAAIVQEALAQAEARGFDAPLVWAAGEGWHPGIVGIVASRLKDAAHRPAIVMAVNGTHVQGSGRSVSGIDLGASIARLVHDDLIEKGGGHAMAAGLTLHKDQIEPAMTRLTDLLVRQGADDLGIPTLTLDGIAHPGGVTLDLMERLDTAGPFGAGAPAPRFALPMQRIAFAAKAGDRHLRLGLSDASGARLDAIAFGAFDTALGAALLDHQGQAFHIAGRFEVDDWGGRRKVKLRVEDAARVS